MSGFTLDVKKGQTLYRAHRGPRVRVDQPSGSDPLTVEVSTRTVKGIGKQLVTLDDGTRWDAYQLKLWSTTAFQALRRLAAAEQERADNARKEAVEADTYAELALAELAKAIGEEAT